MATRGTFATSLCWEDANGDEIEADVRVLYSRDKGFAGDHIDPPEPASIEIISITPADPTVIVPTRFETDDDLIAECMADWAAEEIEAAEWRAQSRRDQLMEGS